MSSEQLHKIAEKTNSTQIFAKTFVWDQVDFLFSLHCCKLTSNIILVEVRPKKYCGQNRLVLSIKKVKICTTYLSLVSVIAIRYDHFQAIISCLLLSVRRLCQIVPELTMILWYNLSYRTQVSVRSRNGTVFVESFILLLFHNHFINRNT